MMQVRRSRAKDDLLGWQIAPYAEAVLAQQHSRAILRAAARLQQVSHGLHAPCIHGIMKFGIDTRVLAKRKLNYCRDLNVHRQSIEQLMLHLDPVSE